MLDRLEQEEEARLAERSSSVLLEALDQQVDALKAAIEKRVEAILKSVLTSLANHKTKVDRLERATVKLVKEQEEQLTWYKIQNAKLCSDLQAMKREQERLASDLLAVKGQQQLSQGIWHVQQQTQQQQQQTQQPVVLTQPVQSTAPASPIVLTQNVYNSAPGCSYVPVPALPVYNYVPAPGQTPAASYSL